MTETDARIKKFWEENLEFEISHLHKAVELLISTEMTLTEIAYECGFSSQSYFSYVFKKRMKLAPRAYAKKIALKYEKNI